MRSLANYLIQDNLLAAELLPELLHTCEQQKISLVSHLVQENIIASEAILNCCVKYFLLPLFDSAKHTMKENILPAEFILRYRIIPVSRNQHIMQIALSDPTNDIAISALRFHTGLSISLILIDEKILDKTLSTYARNNHLHSQLESVLSKITPPEGDNPTKNNDDDGPVSEFVKKLLNDAILQNASDIHIEPFSDSCRIRFRRDGLLKEVATTPPHFAARLVVRLKILADLNIAERRLPQDGRLTSEHDDLDIRINTCPTIFGEKIVLRLLNASKIKLEIDILGFNDEQKELFFKKLSQPQGLILVTGPTGSGKTITLYSALHHLNKMEKNISSVEDPVEMEFAGINQININPRIGLDFAKGLRALLRQDPDIIMIGEIRDKETAEIAVQAAETGHLVLSTLHTNNAIESIARLQSMGIDEHHFTSAVSLVIAQRLVRKLCVHCKNKNECEYCYHGYHGRTGIFECLTINQESHMSLRDSGMTLVKKGITNEEEILRVLGNI